MADTNETLMHAVESYLHERALEFEALADGSYNVVTKSGQITIALDNLSRQFARDQDVAVVDRFLDSIFASLAPLPDWEIARGDIFSMIESREVGTGDNTLTRPISDDTQLVPVYFNKTSGTLRFLRESDAQHWQVTQDDVWNAAESGLDALMRNTEVTYIDAKYLKLGVIQAHEPYKASLIRALSLRGKVESELGWPIYAVAPSRDFVFLISSSDADELGRVVYSAVKEYRSAEYPLSLEVWEISDSGIRAVTTLPEQ